MHVLMHSPALATSGQRAIIRQRCAHTPVPLGAPRDGSNGINCQYRAPSRHRAARTTPVSAVSSGSVDLSGWAAPNPRGAAGASQSTPLDFQLNGSSVSGARGRPRGVVHFLGGAFAGATPQLTVSHSIPAVSYTLPLISSYTCLEEFCGGPVTPMLCLLGCVHCPSCHKRGTPPSTFPMPHTTPSCASCRVQPVRVKVNCVSVRFIGASSTEI